MCEGSQAWAVLRIPWGALLKTAKARASLHPTCRVGVSRCFYKFLNECGQQLAQRDRQPGD